MSPTSLRPLEFETADTLAINIVTVGARRFSKVTALCFWYDPETDLRHSSTSGLAKKHKNGLLGKNISQLVYALERRKYIKENWLTTENLCQPCATRAGNFHCNIAEGGSFFFFTVNMISRFVLSLVFEIRPSRPKPVEPKFQSGSAEQLEFGKDIVQCRSIRNMENLSKTRSFDSMSGTKITVRK